jgi:hypothetical protein
MRKKRKSTTATFLQITIVITKLDEFDGLRFNPIGADFNYKWHHSSGLGFLTPNNGLEESVEDCIHQAKIAYGLKA